tara:strand:- start:760 stop:891 length:132 start_codon:yes stop_codon:yes gene_type:complete
VLVFISFFETKTIKNTNAKGGRKAVKKAITEVAIGDVVLRFPK